MRLSRFPSAVAVITAAIIAAVHAADSKPVITSAVLSGQTLVIAGSGFAAGASVTLGGVPTKVDSISSSKIVIDIPIEIAAVPGSYRLDVSIPLPNPDPPAYATIDVLVPSTAMAGPVGPAGPQGPPGPTGPPGPIAPSGDNLFVQHGTSEFPAGDFAFNIPDGVHDLIVELWGGGGSGGSPGGTQDHFCTGGGGGGGAYVRAVMPVAPGESITLSVAAASGLFERGNDTVLSSGASGRILTAGGGAAGGAAMALREFSAYPSCPARSAWGGAGGSFSAAGDFHGLIARSGGRGDNGAEIWTDTDVPVPGGTGGRARSGSVEPPDGSNSGSAGQAILSVHAIRVLGIVEAGAPPTGGGPGYALISW